MENYSQFSPLQKKTFEDFQCTHPYIQEQSTIDQSKNSSYRNLEKDKQKKMSDYTQLFLDNFQTFNRKEKIETFAQNIQQQKTLTNIEVDLFQEIKTIKYPQQVLDFMKEHKNYFFEHIQEFQQIIFFQCNVFCFYRYGLDDHDTQFSEIFEESLEIQHIKYCGHVQGNQVYLIYLENNVSKFYCLNQQYQLVQTSIKFKQPLQQIFYSFNSNKTFVVDKNNELNILNINIKKQKANSKKLVIGMKDEDFISNMFNKAANNVAKISDFLISGIQQQKVIYYFKEFFNYIIILQKQYYTKNDQQYLRSQTFLVFQIQQNQQLELYKKFDIKEIVQYNINLIDQIEFKQNLFQNSFNINDYLFDQDQFLILLSSGIEIQFNCISKVINQIVMISLKLAVFNNICFEQYYDKNQILVSDEEQQFIIDKTMICPLVLFDSNLVDNYALLPLQKFGMYSLNKLNDKSQCKQQGQLFLKFDVEKGIEIYKQVRDIDILVDLLYIDYSIEKGKNAIKYLDFYKEFYSLKNQMRNVEFQTLLFQTLLQYNSVVKQQSDIFLKSMQYRFNIQQNDLYEEFFQHSVMLQSILKYVMLFNFDNQETQNQNNFMIQQHHKKKDQMRDFDYVFLYYLYDMYQKIGPQVIFTMQKKQPKQNLQLVYQIDNLIQTQNQLSNIVFLLNQKNISSQEIQNSYFYTIKVLNQLKTTKFCSNFNEQFSNLVQQSVCDIVNRIKHVLQFCNYCYLAKNSASIEALQNISDIEIQSLIFYDKNNQKIKSFLGLTAQQIKDQKGIFNIFFNQNEMNALQLLLDYVNDSNSIKANHSDTDHFINQMKYINFDILDYYLELFWINKDFDIFIAAIIIRLNNINNENDPVLKSEVYLIQTFLFAVVIQLLNNNLRHEKKQSKGNQILSEICNKLKQSVFLGYDNDKQAMFYLEKELKNLNKEDGKKTLQSIINMILKSPIAKLRKTLLFMLFRKNSSFIKNIDYQYKLDDLVDLRTNKDLFQGEIGKENVDYMIKFFKQKNQYENCVKLVIAVVEKQTYDNFFEQFKHIGDIYALLDQNHATKIKKQLKSYEVFNLDFLKAFLKTAIEAEKNMKIDKTEQSKIKETLQALKLQLDLNLQIYKELENKKRILEKIQMLKSIKIDQKEIKKFIGFLKLQIRLINLNPKIERDSFSEKIIHINKLHMILLQQCYTKLSINNVQFQKKLENGLKYFGNFNSIKNVGKISNYFKLGDEYNNKSFFILYTSTDKVDNNLFKELQRLFLLYPLNVPNEYKYILEDFFLEQGNSIENLKSLFRNIETLNIASKYLQQMVVSSNCNDEIKDNNLLWHLNFLYKIFKPSKPEKNLSIIYIILEVYNQLIQEQNNTGDLIKENLTNKYIHSFTNVYELLITSVRKLIKNKYQSEEIVNYLNKFQSLNSHLIQILKNIRAIKPSTFASHQLQTYFKSQEKISKLISYGIAVQNMRNQQFQFNQTIICAFLKSFYSIFILILYSTIQQNIKTIQTIPNTTQSFAYQFRPDFIIKLYSNAVYSCKNMQNIEQTNMKEPIKQISAQIKFYLKYKFAAVVIIAPIQVYIYIANSSQYGRNKFIITLQIQNPAAKPINDLYMVLNYITNNKKNTAVNNAIE